MNETWHSSQNYNQSAQTSVKITITADNINLLFELV